MFSSALAPLSAIREAMLPAVKTLYELVRTFQDLIDGHPFIQGRQPGVTRGQYRYALPCRAVGNFPGAR